MPIRNITLPPTHNQRAPEQWRIISGHVDFEGKTVLDLGCGYGDIMHRCHNTGARYVLGLDKDMNLSGLLSDKRQIINYLDYAFCDMDSGLSQWVYDRSNPGWNIIICFSVLPYLTDPTATLHWIRQHSEQALIECQLSGDGPGPDWLKCPQDMRRWLDSIGWQSVERIGETTVKDRGTKRGIWLCQ